MPITANNLVQAGANLIIVNNWLMFPFIMAFAAFITVFFYLSVPFVASAVMKGLSGTTASLQAGVQGAMQTGIDRGRWADSGRSAATFGGSAAVQAAIQGTKTAAEGATAAGRIANDLAGASGFEPGAQSSAGDGSNLPAPPLAPATVGRTLREPFQPRPGDSFTVIDSVHDTISHHKGNIYTPYAAQAAFNAHSSKARQGPPLLPKDKPV